MSTEKRNKMTQTPHKTP